MSGKNAQKLNVFCRCCDGLFLTTGAMVLSDFVKPPRLCIKFKPPRLCIKSGIGLTENVRFLEFELEKCVVTVPVQ